jgi:methanethiol S-methyltransferase
MKMESNATKHGECCRDGRGRSVTSGVIFLAGSYLFGTISLLLWVAFLSRGGLGIVDLGFGLMGALLFDASLSLAFFAQHSLMVRRSFKEWAARRIGRDYLGAVYAIGSGFVLLSLSLLWQGPVQRYTVLGGIPRFLMQGASLLALGGFIWGVRSLGSFDMFGTGPIFRSLRGLPEPEPLPLTIRGPYRWVRHPLYTSCLLAIWAVSDITADRLLYNIMWTGWIIVGAMLEERDLVAAFGAAYQAYRARVPMLVPWRVRPMQPASSPSSGGRLHEERGLKPSKVEGGGSVWL